MLPNANVPVLLAQASALKVLKNMGTNISFSKPKKGAHTMSISIFADAGRVVDHGQLCFISGLLIGPLAINSVFHTLSWISHKSKRPVRSVAAAEILAASEAIDEGKILNTTITTLTGIPVSCKLLSALSTSIHPYQLVATPSTSRSGLKST